MSLTANIIGQAGSGKSTLARHLQDTYGFKIYRPSDTIRDYAIVNGISLTSRGDYIRAHMEMLDHDPSIITRSVLQLEGLVCIDGLRVPNHAQSIQEVLNQNCEKLGYVTIALGCSDELRFERTLNRGDDSTRAKHQSLEEFLRDEVQDNQTLTPSAPSVPMVMGMADVLIDTENRDPEDVAREVGGWLTAVFDIESLEQI